MSGQFLFILANKDKKLHMTLDTGLSHVQYESSEQMLDLFTVTV